LAILRRLNGVRGYRCRVDKLGKISEDDLAALVDRGLVEHVRTAPMVVAEQWGGPHSIEDVAVYGITKAGRRIVQAYNDEAGKQRLAREGRQAA
jgi:hypothetical protein